MLRRHRATARFVPAEDDVRAHTLRLLRPRPLVCGVAFSLAVTTAAAFVLVALVDDLSSASLQVGDALVALALSTLAGIVSLVPGGWGVADGSLSGLLRPSVLVRAWRSRSRSSTVSSIASSAP